MASSEVVNVFFSYKWVDSYATVCEVYDRLCNKTYIQIWRDTKSLFVGQNIDEQICRGIDESNVFVCFLSRNYYAGSMETNKCLQEFRYAMSKGLKVIFVMLENIDVNTLPEVIKFHANAQLRLNAFELPTEYRNSNKTIVDYICHELKNAFKGKRTETGSKRTNNSAAPSNNTTQPQDPALATVRNFADKAVDILDTLVPEEERPDSFDINEYRSTLNGFVENTFQYLKFIKKIKDSN